MRQSRWLAATILAALVLIVAGVATGAARYTPAKVDVVYGDIQVYVDGKKLDTRGVEPFLLADQGVLVVPVRALGEALGKAVTWDEANGAVYLGRVPEQIPAPAPPTPAQSAPVYLEDLKVLRKVGSFYLHQERMLYVAGRPFGRGLAVEMAKDGKAETVVDLAGKFSTLQGYIGVEDETRNSSGAFVLVVYGDDIELFRSPVMKPSDYPYFISVNVKGVKRLTLAVQWQEGGIGEYDRLIAALANLELRP